MELHLREGRPASLRDRRRGRLRTVESVEEVWRVEDGWWRGQSLVRTYFRLLLTDGDVVTVYQEGAGPDWWLQRYSG